MKYLGIILITIAVSIGTFAVLNRTDNVGAITTILGTDKLSDSRTTINDNFTDLDTTKMEMSTTSVASITTLSGLVSIGTITTGTWGATDVTVANGGTGLSTLTANAVMLGAGASNVNFVSGLGSSGQFLTSQGASSDPTWTTSAIDQALDYIWTGHHIFSTLFATNASSTNATTTNNLRVQNDLYVDGGIGTTTVGGLQIGTTTFTGDIIFEGTNVGTLIQASDELQASADTERQANSTSYVLEKQITVRGYGTARITFDIKRVTSGSADWELRVLSRDNSTETVVFSGSEASFTYVTKSTNEKVDGVTEFRLYTKNPAAPGSTTDTRNFRVKFTRGGNTTTVDTD